MSNVETKFQIDISVKTYEELSDEQKATLTHRWARLLTDSEKFDPFTDLLGYYLDSARVDITEL